MFKRTISFLLCLVLFSSIFSACGSAKPAEGSVAESSKAVETQKQAKEPTTITFWASNVDRMDEYFKKEAVEFGKINPGIKVEYTMLPAPLAEVETKLNAAKMSGTFPDVTYAVLALLGTWGSRGEFAELDGYINKWEEKDDIYQSTLDIGKVKGKYVGLGMYPVPIMLAYRKDMFQVAGLDPSKPPQNWDELSQYALKLTKKDTNGKVIQAGLDIPAIDPTMNVMEPFMWQNGALVVDDVKQVPVLDDPKAADALKFVADLYNQNITTPFNWQKKETSPFMTGTGAMAFVMPNEVQALLKNKPELEGKIAYGPVLQKEKKAAFCGYRLLVIGKDSKFKNEAWEFMKYMLSKDVMWKRYQDWKVAPVRKSLEDQFIKANPEFNTLLLDYIKFGRSSGTVPWNSIRYKYMNPAYESVLQKKNTAEAALKEAQTKILREIENMK